MSTLALLLLLAADPAYLRSLEQFRAAREAELKKPDGWLAVAGLFWLDEGDATAGADPKSAIVLPAPAPAKLGVFTLRGREVRFRAAAPNLATLRDDGFVVLDPAMGWQACRAIGPGRLPEADELVDALAESLRTAAAR